MYPVAVPSQPSKADGKQGEDLIPKLSSTEVMQLEHEYSAHNYHPLPVVFERAKGSEVWDPEGNRYLDFLSAYSAVNQGHCHPRIVNALTTQAQKLTLSSRAFYNNVFGLFAKTVTETFGYEMVLPMNTGAEAVETALKLARKWAYVRKGVPENRARILSVEGNFHGRTIGIVSMSTDPDSTTHFGPFLPHVGPTFPVGEGEAPGRIRYNNLGDLERALERHGKETAAFLVEPIQGEAGIVVPDEGYLRGAQELCRKWNVLLICDEIQTGLGRTGKMLCCEHDNVKPDIVVLGKALSGGVYPVSAVLSSKEIMLTIEPGSHGSTYGGNPLGCAVSIAALRVLLDEDLSSRAATLGERFRARVRAIQSPLIKEVRGKGLLNAVEIDESQSKRGRTAWDLCLVLKSKGVLAKPTHQNIIRFAPPLVITDAQLDEGIAAIEAALADLDRVESIPGKELEEDTKLPSCSEE